MKIKKSLNQEDLVQAAVHEDSLEGRKQSKVETDLRNRHLFKLAVKD